MRTTFLISFAVLSCIISCWGQEDPIVNYTDINGMKQGFWLMKDKDGNKVYEGYFKNNVPYGQMKKYHKNGIIKAVMTFDTLDQKKTAVVYFDDTGEKSATGFFYNKQRDSLWQYFGVGTKLVAEEYYKRGLRNGVSRKFYPSGKVVEEINYRDGKLTGLWLRYYENGNLRMKTQNVEDKRDGDFFSYFANGKPEIHGFYKNDIREGTWKKYNEKNEVIKELKFTSGKLENEEEVDREFTKEIEDAEKNKGKFKDPAESMDSNQPSMQGGE